MVVYGIYAAMFRVRPAAHPMSFLVAMMGIGSMMILPFYLWEVVQGGRIGGGLPAWLALVYIAVFPSFIAYLFFNRGIELIGATRASQSWHLMPVFGSILAVLFLGETFYLYHAIGIAMIAAGILLASVKRSGAVRPPVACSILQHNLKPRARGGA
jgi:drug/metabolite transporter (DMT)-like permease